MATRKLMKGQSSFYFPLNHHGGKKLQQMTVKVKRS